MGRDGTLPQYIHNESSAIMNALNWTKRSCEIDPIRRVVVAGSSSLEMIVAAADCLDF